MAPSPESAALLACVGCGGMVPDIAGPTHPYMRASPGCWLWYGALSARHDYADVARPPVHWHHVDCYAVQHPGGARTERRQRQSVAVHLIALCLFNEHGIPPQQAPRHRRQMSATVLPRMGLADWPYLEPPPSLGGVTAADLTRLLGFDLLPRIKRINKVKLYRPDRDSAYPALEPAMTRPIRWDLIEQNYDLMIKYATAIQVGTATTEAILRRFTRNASHPVYQAMLEVGRAQKTIFVAKYLFDRDLQHEIEAGLNVVENFNNGNDVIYFGSAGEFATNNRDRQERAMLTLQLLQSALNCPGFDAASFLAKDADHAEEVPSRAA